ncbi:cyclic nucleotide-binding domain-containing protein [Nostoc sp. FACHB-892]|nr:cyclic nucleotide-binding domain-containing protein [Nostoc sp. FACHB-892]
MPNTKNLLLAALSPDVYEHLKNNMEQVELSSGSILNRPNETINEVYFPLTCLISVTITMMNGMTVEAGVVGSREMVGINAFMGGRETTQTQQGLLARFLNISETLAVYKFLLAIFGLIGSRSNCKGNPIHSLQRFDIDKHLPQKS